MSSQLLIWSGWWCWSLVTPFTAILLQFYIRSVTITRRECSLDHVDAVCYPHSWHSPQRSLERICFSQLTSWSGFLVVKNEIWWSAASSCIHEVDSRNIRRRLTYLSILCSHMPAISGRVGNSFFVISCSSSPFFFLMNESFDFVTREERKKEEIPHYHHPSWSSQE